MEKFYSGGGKDAERCSFIDWRRLGVIPVETDISPRDSIKFDMLFQSESMQKD